MHIFLIQSSNKDKEIRFKEIIKVFNDINKLINENDLLNDYNINIYNNLF